MPCLADMSYFVCWNNEVADLLKMKLNAGAESWEPNLNDGNLAMESILNLWPF